MAAKRTIHSQSKLSLLGHKQIQLFHWNHQKIKTKQYTDEAMSRVASCGWISVHIFQCAYRNQHTVGENFTLISDSTISLPHSSSICLSVMRQFFATYPLRDDSFLIFCLWTISEFHYYSQVNYFREGDFKHHLLVERLALLWLLCLLCCELVLFCWRILYQV